MALFLYPKQGGDRMADNFGLKIGVEGEKEFKKALSEINQNFKMLGSEMKLVSSQFDKNDKSVDALTARNQVLNKEIDEQKTEEAKLFRALDKLEAAISHNEADLRTWLPLEYDLNPEYGYKECQFSEYTKQLKETVRQNSLDKIKSEK